MDGSRPDRPVNPARPVQRQLRRAPPKNKLLKVSSAPAELTPLTRLARFKEIRDRNLAKASSARNPRRSNLTVQLNSAKMMTNGSDGKSNTNVLHATNGNTERREVPSGPVNPKSPIKNGVELVEPSPKRPQPSPKNAEPSVHKPAPSAPSRVEDESPQNGVEPQAQIQIQEEETSEVFILEFAEGEAEAEAGSGSEADGDVENGHESEGSSLDVVIDESSSGESLDLQVSADFQTPQKTTVDVPVGVPGPSGSTLEPASNVDELYVPDVIKRLKSGGHISSRPTLRGKRRYEDDTSSSGGKRHCDGSSSAASLSTSWQFFSPSSALKRVWSRQGEPTEAKPEDDSMIVNVSANPPKSQKWCRIM